MLTEVGVTSTASPVVEIKVTLRRSDSSGIVSFTTSRKIVVEFCPSNSVTVPDDGVTITSAEDAEI